MVHAVFLEFSANFPSERQFCRTQVSVLRDGRQDGSHGMSLQSNKPSCLEP